jgi:hypothetical protein
MQAKTEVDQSRKKATRVLAAAREMGWNELDH